jgi:hypothetical protein
MKIFPCIPPKKKLQADDTVKKMPDPKMLDVPWGKKKPTRRDYEIGVFRFELARRFDRRPRKCGQPYPFADPLTRDLLAPFTSPPSPVLIGSEEPSQRVKYIKVPPISFCARSARGEILQRVGLLVDKECRELGIELPKGPEGRQNRPPSWRRLELLDRRDILHEKIVAENDRVKIAPARKDAERLRKELIRLIHLNEEPAEPPEE